MVGNLTLWHLIEHFQRSGLRIPIHFKTSTVTTIYTSRLVQLKLYGLEIHFNSNYYLIVGYPACLGCTPLLFQ